MQTLSEQILRRAKIALNVWTILTICCAVFLIMPFLSEPMLKGAPAVDPLLLRRTLTAIASLMAMSTVFIRAYLLSPPRLRLLGNRLKTGIESPEVRLSKFLQQWFTFNVIAWGVNESIASFGVVIFGLTGETSAASPFAIAGVLLNLLMFPNFKLSAARAGLI